MRTLDEVRERIEKQSKDSGDSLMIQIAGHHPLAIYCPEMYKEGHQHEAEELTKEAIVSEMSDYMPFAIGKAEGERGISASRSIWKYEQWLWVLEDELGETIGDYDDYGLGALNQIAEKYNLPKEEP